MLKKKKKNLSPCAGVRKNVPVEIGLILMFWIFLDPQFTPLIYETSRDVQNRCRDYVTTYVFADLNEDEEKEDEGAS